MIKDTNKQPWNCLIEHLEEEDLKVKHPNSIMVISLHSEQGKELVKEYMDDAQVILSEFHDHHTNSEMAQHEIVELTSYITNLFLTDGEG